MRHWPVDGPGSIELRVELGVELDIEASIGAVVSVEHGANATNPRGA